MTARFEIGTQFIPVGNKRKDVYTIVDILTTTKSNGDIFKIEYGCTHSFLGQTIGTIEIDTTISRGLIDKSILERLILS